MNNIRNFVIIAHIDHGKSTLADRFLEITKTVEKREMEEQLLDTMELEKERGITIKLQPVRMDYEHNNEKFVLNLIDTPGHVDFSYEVSRSLAAVEGAILLIDASQGIEAQTLSNVYLAIEHNLTIIPVINKIDLPHAEPEKATKEVISAFGFKEEEILFASGKTGQGVESILQEVIKKVPPPTVKNENKLQALIFDSFYDPYKGVVVYVRIFGGALKKNEKIKFLQTGAIGESLEVGYLKPKLTPTKEINDGEIGYIVTGLKNVSQARVGDTISILGNEAQSIPGYKKVKPFVFAGLFTVEGEDYPILRDAIEKLSLSDSSLEYSPENSQALGFGFRCGFLGLLHMDIIKERLEREFGLDLIVTTPSVSYELTQATGEERIISNPSELPDPTKISEIREPVVKVEIISPKEYVGKILELVNGKRGKYKDMQYLDTERALMVFEIPLATIVMDFYDQLKSISSGYASMSYEFLGYFSSELVKLDILVAGDLVEPLSLILHKDEAYNIGLKILERLKEIIPRQQFQISLQAAIGARILARENIAAFRKDVTQKLYGGDVTRKKKLLEKQKKGKRKMKRIGSVDIPKDAFLALLKK